VAATDEYVARVQAGADPVAERRILSSEEQLSEALFMGLRLTEGISLPAIEERFGVDVLKRYGESLDPFVEEGLLIATAAQWRLTRRGMLLASEVMQVFV
jgi:oxygen-independent coproporphyrinogen-3 oxidase